MTKTPVFIHSIFTAEGHSYWGHSVPIPGPHPVHSHSSVALVKGSGIPGDRFFNRKLDYDGQITLFSQEVYQELIRILKPGNPSPGLFRRNILVEGIPLNQLIGQEFKLNGIILFGSGHCTPCKWMDFAFGPGALKFLQGRGGLRCRILQDGRLSTGPGEIETSITLDLSQICEPIRPFPLP